jgi:putative flippase GtrA
MHRLGKYTEFIRFCLVGLSNTFSDILIYALMHQVFGLGTILSSTVTTFSVVVVSYIANTKFVFKRELSFRIFGKFLLTTCLGIVLIQGAITTILEPHVQGVVKNILGESSSDIFVANSFTRITGTAFSLFWNYLFYKYLVFAVRGKYIKTNTQATILED